MNKLHPAQIQDMRNWNESLQRLIKRRFKIDLTDRKTGFMGKPLNQMTQDYQDILEFANSVHTMQQAKISELHRTANNFVMAFSDLQGIVNRG